jgi:hypothetical protein|uniref:AAA domain protein n=1 Tax=Myoviridae sp. ct9MV2 TaxID=2826625 RepID=A0A8S5NDD8_9CAUD|nr:MAG TPA: AAA domain protein [Myoviridae sp. ct9MV2]DAS75170.1 MAG TPA: AAA domain protein [Caudoviricetes sp.]
MVTNDIKQRIVAAVAEDRKKYRSDAEHSRKLDLSTSVYSEVFNSGKIDRKISDDGWMDIAMRLKLNLKDNFEWKTANTPTYDYIYTQLERCQEERISLIFCDEAGIGKTYTATQYVKENAEAILVDCSQSKSKRRLIKAIAQEFGVATTGKYADVYERLVYYLNNFANSPLIILDEAGDLQQDAYLELKALWNITQGNCGWYMMGAVGLKRKIDRAKDNEKVGYAELFDRYGCKYQSITGEDKWANDLKLFNATQIAIVANANAPKADIQKLIAGADGSLRRVVIEVKKLKRGTNG